MCRATLLRVRLVMMADTHSYHEDLEVPEGDVLIHAGDLTRLGRVEALAEVAAFLGRQPHPHKIVIAGNHDWCFVHAPDEARANLSAVTYLEDEGIGDRTYDGRNEGCDDLLARVRSLKPRVHVFGHIHEDPGQWTHGPTTFINATVAECTLPVQVFDL